ncbi:hypothetical protein DITRI_Ditri04bG0181700 [Diplodiscus trichospermus]
MRKSHEETVEHLFLCCPFAGAVWFGSNLSIRTDRSNTDSLRNWIMSWLEKTCLTNDDTWWFYGQFH